MGSGLINPFMRICTIKDSALLKAMPNLRCKRSADTLPSSRRQATARLKYSLLTTSPTCSSASTPLPESSIGYSRPCRHPHRPLSHRTAHSPASQFPERPATTGKSHTSFHSPDRLLTYSTAQSSFTKQLSKPYQDSLINDSLWTRYSKSKVATS